MLSDLMLCVEQASVKDPRLAVYRRSGTVVPLSLLKLRALQKWVTSLQLDSKRPHLSKRTTSSSSMEAKSLSIKKGTGEPKNPSVGFKHINKLQKRAVILPLKFCFLIIRSIAHE